MASDSSSTQLIEELAKSDVSCSTHLIDEKGVLIAPSLEAFVQSVKLPNCAVSYAVVAIMGPQSSGKSTLLNHLFSTNFDTMDSTKSRTQTTKGVWMAKAVNVDPLTIIMDIEGNDGEQRGQDHPFERQTALFALALADVVLINMWHKDMGRENGANKPLLKTVFEAMTKLFSPRKTTLLFVIRDRNMRTSVDTIESDLIVMIQKIWDDVPKPEARVNASLEDFFIVKVIALSHYEFLYEQFIEEVAELREQFRNSIAPGGLAGDSQERVPGSGFATSVHNIWDVIKNDKDLDLPTHKVMVATVRCDAIADEKFHNLKNDEDWKSLEVVVQSGPVPDFGKKLSSILSSYLSEYDEEARYFDESVREAKRGQLEAKLLEIVKATYKILLHHHISKAKENFDTQLEMELTKGGEEFDASVLNCKQACMDEFDKQCAEAIVEQATNVPDWDVVNVKEELRCYIETHSLSLRNKKISEIVASHEKKLSDTIAGANIETTLIEGGWSLVRQIITRETDVVVSEFLSSISGFKIDDSILKDMIRSLRKYARSLVEKKARKVSQNALNLMKDRFTSAFNRDQESMPRLWTAEKDIRKIAQDARLVALKILSVLTVIRFEEKADNIEKILYSSLMDQSTSDVSKNPLASNVWKEVSPADIIVTPVECMTLWRRFIDETGNVITQATISQETNKAKDAAEAVAAAAKLKADAAKKRTEENEARVRAELDAVNKRAEENEARVRAELDAANKRAVENEARVRAELDAANKRAEESSPKNPVAGFFNAAGEVVASPFKIIGYGFNKLF